MVKGDVYNPEEVSAAIQGCEGVLIALGRGSDISPTTLFSEGTRNIATGMKEHGVRRIVICNSALVFHERLELTRRFSWDAYASCIFTEMHKCTWYGFTVRTSACVAATKVSLLGVLEGIYVDVQHVLYGTLNPYSHFHIISIFRFCTSI